MKVYKIIPVVCATTMLLFFSSCTTNTSFNKEIQKSDEISSISLQSIHAEEKTTEFEYTIEYPSFPEYPVLNAEIEKIVTQWLGNFPQESVTSWNEMKKEFGNEWISNRAPYFLGVSWKGAQINTDYISIILDCYAYTGGAHGNSQIISINYDCTRGKIVSLQDVIAPQTDDWLQRLALDAQTALSAEINPEGRKDLKEWIESGCGAELTNFTSFTFSGDTLTLYFQSYQVGPYYVGMPVVHVRISDYRFKQ